MRWIIGFFVFFLYSVSYAEQLQRCRGFPVYDLTPDLSDVEKKALIDDLQPLAPDFDFSWIYKIYFSTSEIEDRIRKNISVEEKKSQHDKRLSALQELGELHPYKQCLLASVMAHSHRDINRELKAIQLKSGCMCADKTGTVFEEK